MSDKKLALPRLPEFELTREQIDIALKHPIVKKYRRELVLPSDKDKANAWNRITVKGINEFHEQTGMPIATLIRQLLVLYFTGNLYRSNNQSIAASYEFADDDGVSDEYVDDVSFDFPGLKLD